MRRGRRRSAWRSGFVGPRRCGRPAAFRSARSVTVSASGVLGFVGHYLAALFLRFIEATSSGWGWVPRMRMLGAGVEVQRLHLLAPKRAARDHPLDGLLEHALGEAAVEHLVGGHFLEAAGVAGVLVVDLLTALVAGEADLLDVDDDDVVAAVDVRGEARLVLAAQDDWRRSWRGGRRPAPRHRSGATSSRPRPA